MSSTPRDPSFRQMNAEVNAPASPADRSFRQTIPALAAASGQSDAGAGGAPAEVRNLGALLRRMLAISDWLALVGALSVTTLLSSTTDMATLFWALLVSPVWILVVKLQSLYDHDHRRIRHSTVDELTTLITCAVIGTVGLDILLGLSPVGPLSTSSAVLIAVLWLVTAVLARALIRFLWHGLIGVGNGVIVARQELAETIARRLAVHPEARLRLIGYLGPAPPSAQIGELEWLGAPSDLPKVAREHEIERVVVAGGEIVAEEAERLIDGCKDLGLGLSFLPRHFRLFGPGIEMNRVAALPVIDFRFSDSSRSTMFLKRVMDIVVSAALLALLSPLFVLISALVVLDSGRPVFFRQARAGKEGEPFRMIKFRTMVADAEDRLHELVDLADLDEPMFKLANDPRVTRVGSFLRRTSLDELPQFINVLRGTMSLVGPRPEQEAIVALYDEHQRTRLQVKPGLTGPMQVFGRGDLTFEERLALERDYLDNISIGGDLAILLRTPIAALRGNGAY